jgi:hypothetical protein
MFRMNKCRERQDAGNDHHPLMNSEIRLHDQVTDENHPWFSLCERTLYAQT